ncbi:regulatory subunit of NAD-dependent isocitrate dehydrogenase [Chloropicon primus]|uniref:NAD-dependent isocitrate dehydrogenase n=2 Tax=Chloropicon primus TaxID=1764295 RepID=A0A5B8MWF0_9CHLO|nr:NAD-dependent isocitrate dehydrogenase [Chloropicon primus]UPR02993.1 regulatory subunit of NAD-dependent isocitrate dehydrogenase [Chloropicon primus]|eukprot:QDZ23780.1 NAD-dependent isocitrate dehydrogenase [Chloropicon primus]
MMLSRLGRICSSLSRQGLVSRALLSTSTYVHRPGEGSVKRVTLLPGDGIGPEVTQCVERVVDVMKVPIVWEKFNSISGADADGHPVEALPEELLASLRRNKVCIKGTLFAPLYKENTNTQSLNVLLRKELDLYVNLVHAFSIPEVQTRHEDIDIVIVRENTEGEYSGLEHEVVPGVVESLKVITEKNSRRIAEYAFEYALMNNRKKVTAVHKANIMKLGDGQFLSVCRETAAKFPTIEFEEMIVDATCMRLVSNPQDFDVMVTPNLYGNLIANLAAGLAGGAGIVPGVNLGSEGIAVFEQGARHVARSLQGKNLANPTAMLLSSAMLFRHLQWPSMADRLETAIMKVLQDPALHTTDIDGSATTSMYMDAIVKEL